MFIELRMYKTSDNYKHLETRTHYNNLQLQNEIEAYPKITVADLFKAEHPSGTIPVRSLVIGKAGIGKTMLSMHIADQWLKNELLTDNIHQLFLFHLRDLSGIEKCSLEDLFFMYQSCEMPSPEVISEFFQQLLAEPDKTLIIFDGLDEVQFEPMKKTVFPFNKQIGMPELIASIVNGWIIPSTRVIVTSRPGGPITYNAYDKKAEIFGFTREKISDYVVEFSGGNQSLRNSIEHYIDQNVNIRSLCYIPVQLNMICRIVKERMQQENNPQFPETLTELFVGSIRNFLVNHHPDFKDVGVAKTVDVIAKLRYSVFNHSRIALYGMAQVPIKAKFSADEIHNFQLESVATQCGLLTESRESSIVRFAPAVKSVYYFQHLTMQEFLASVGLLNETNQVRSMLTKASERQLDLMVIFLAGLLGNDRTHAFLDTLQLKRTLCLKTLVKLVVQRERRKESKIDVMNRSTAHKASTLLLVMILYESRQADLWSHVSDYVLNGKHELDLGGQHISPSELHALAYVLPETGITSLK